MTVLKDAPEVEASDVVLQLVKQAKDLGADKLFVFGKQPLQREWHQAAIYTPDELAVLFGHVRCGDHLPLRINEGDIL
jgi:hypothetical protein